MGADTINPQLLLSKLTNFEALDAVMNIPRTGFGTLDFENISFDNEDFGMTNPGLMGPDSFDFGMLESSRVDAGLMWIDSMYSGSTDSEDLNLNEIAATPTDSGMLRPEAAGFDISGLRHSCTTPSHPMHPGTMSNQRTEYDEIDIDVLENNIMDDTMAHHHTTRASNLDLSTRVIDIAGDHQIFSLNPGLQFSAAGQCDIVTEVSYTHTYPPLPRHIYLGDSAARQRITSGNWREYQPKRLDASTTRAKITANDWEEYRPFIEQLYVVENVKLKDVMRILETKFDFVATEKMYKTKLAQWGLTKNYKATEKEHLARVVKAHRDSGGSAPQLTLRNRPAKMSRVRRFCKQQKFLEEICHVLPNESSSNANVISPTKASFGRATTAGVTQTTLKGVHKYPSFWMSGLRQTLFDPERPFTTDSHEARIEIVLFQTRVFQQSCFALARDSDMLGRAGDLATENTLEYTAGYAIGWREKLVFGVGALVQQKFTQGWQMLSEACEIFRRVLDEDSQNLFSQLFYALGDRDWARHLDLCWRLLQFFTKSSAAKLGCNHPISIVLYHLQEQRTLADAIMPTFEVLMSVCEEYLSPTNEELWQLKVAYCNTLIQLGDDATAESYALRSLKQCEEVNGRLHLRTRELLVELGDLYRYQRQHERAESGYQDALQRGREELGDEFPDIICIYAFQGLAWIWEKRGDFAQSEEYWREVLALSLAVWDMEDELPIYIIAQLGRSFRNQSKDPEAWLQENFGISCV